MSGLKLTLTGNPRIRTGHGAFTSAAAAATNLGTAAHMVAAGFGMAGLAITAARQAEETANDLRALMADRVEPHAFTPDLDLACTHPRCTLTAEQH